MKYITEIRTIAIQHIVPISSGCTEAEAIEHIEQGNAKSYSNSDCIERIFDETSAEVAVGVMYRGHEVAT